MISYKCQHCDAELESPDSLAGNVDTCGECGKETYVAEPESKTLRRRTKIYCEVAGLAGLLGLVLVIVIMAWPRPAGEFPSFDDIAKQLNDKGYFLYSPDSQVATLRNRRLQAFKFVQNANDQEEYISVYCDLDDKQKTRAIMSVWEWELERDIEDIKTVDEAVDMKVKLIIHANHRLMAVKLICDYAKCTGWDIEMATTKTTKARGSETATTKKSYFTQNGFIAELVTIECTQKGTLSGDYGLSLLRDKSWAY